MDRPVILTHLVMDADRTRRACDGMPNEPAPLTSYPDVPRILCPMCLGLVSGFRRCYHCGKTL